jgi:gas vesicle protein
MAQTSDEIKHDIEATRDRMGDTVEALAYKADVPTRTKEWLGEKKDAVTSKVQAATPDGRQVKRQMGVVKDTAERNPLGLAIGGAAVGFLAGLLLPSTRVEDERIGPVADEVKSTAAEAGKEALERGRHVAQEAGESALETATERGREETEQLTASLQEKARNVASADEQAQTAAEEPTTQPRSGEST